MSAIGSYLDRTCTLQKPARVSDGQGGWTTTFSDFATGVDCRRRPAGNTGPTTAQQDADRRATDIAHIVYLDPAQDVTDVARVLVDGLTLRIVSSEVPSVPAYRALACAEVQQTGE